MCGQEKLERQQVGQGRKAIAVYTIYFCVKEDMSTVKVEGKGEAGLKRKINKMNAKNEKDWILYSPEYAPSAEINQTYMNTPHQIAERGWLPEWGLHEAVRELLSNMIDQARKVIENTDLEKQELQFSDSPGRLFVHVGNVLLAEARWKKKFADYVTSYFDGGIIKAKAVRGDHERVETQCIELINYGSALPWKAFQIGVSSKKNSKTMIGKHGEGLPGACVVLNREACNLTAECTHHGFTANVFNLDSAVKYQLRKRKLKAKDLPNNTVRFTIVFDPDEQQVSPEQLMGSVRLSSTAAAAGITTTRGTLLTERALRGKQFNRSIFVNEDEHCLFGYDFLDPDKTLLQGRDRNSHGKGNCLTECGRILSEAILQSEEVREEVLKCFLYSKRYDPNNPEGEELGEYEDIKDGRYLSAAAVHALRQQHPSGEDAIFCSQSSGKLSEITAATGMNVVFAHRLLHNHAAVINSFDTELVRDSRDISEDSRIYAHREKLTALLRVTQLRLSRLVLSHAQTGFWIREGVAYITGAAQLGTAKDEGLTEAQEITLNRTLQACSVPLENIVKIVRLLRNQPEHIPPAVIPAPTPAPDAALAAKLSLRDAIAQQAVPTGPADFTPASPSLVSSNGSESSRPRHDYDDDYDDDDGESEYSGSGEEVSEWEGEDGEQNGEDSDGNGHEPAWDKNLRRKSIDTSIPVSPAEKASKLTSTSRETSTDQPSESNEQDSKRRRTVPEDAPCSTHVPQHSLIPKDSAHVACESDNDYVGGADMDEGGNDMDYDCPDSFDDQIILEDAHSSVPSHDVVHGPLIAGPNLADAERADSAETTKAVSIAVTAGLPDSAPSTLVATAGVGGNRLCGESSTDPSGTNPSRAAPKAATTATVQAERDIVVTAQTDPACSGVSPTCVERAASLASKAAIDSLKFVLRDPPASISLGKGRPCVYRLSHNAATGVWLYSDSEDKDIAGKLAAQLEWCVPSSMDRHKLLLLSALVHIVVFTSADASAALVFNSECNCVCVNLSSEGVNETIFKYFLRSQLKLCELF